MRNKRINRDEALAELQRPAIDEEQLSEDRAFVIKKLGLTKSDFAEIMSDPRKTFWDYPSDKSRLRNTEEYKRFWQKIKRHRGFEKHVRDVGREILWDPVGAVITVDTDRSTRVMREWEKFGAFAKL